MFVKGIIEEGIRYRRRKYPENALDRVIGKHMGHEIDR